MVQQFREHEFGKKLEKMSRQRMKGYKDNHIQVGDTVFYQTQNEKAWLEPVSVKGVEDGKWGVKKSAEI